MQPRLDHKSICNVLIKNNFYQNVKHVDSGWFHKCGLIVYYIRYEANNIYIVRYQLDTHEVKTVRDLNNILTKYKNKKILQ